ncbi:MAG: VOC family protein [Acidimicrobiia bacterium]|nr:VOC family protein [Acidimicrobiia bacterium]
MDRTVLPFEQQVTFVSVSDLERSTSFYRDVLGLPLALDQGDCRIFEVTPTAFVGVCVRADAVSPEGVIVTLVTDDVDGWHDHLMAAGVRCERPPNHNEKYDLYQAFYRDPDGYLIEIQRFLDPAWRTP